MGPNCESKIKGTTSTPKPPSLTFQYNMLIGMAVGGVLNTALVVELLVQAYTRRFNGSES